MTDSDQFINFESDYSKNNRKKINEYINETMNDENMFECNDYFENMTFDEVDNLANKDNLKDYYKAALYFKNQELIKENKKVEIEREKFQELNELCDEYFQELDNLENNNMKLEEENIELKKKINKNNKYAYFLEGLCFLNLMMLLLLDYLMNGKMISIYINSLTSFTFISYLNFFIIFSILVFFYNLKT